MVALRGGAISCERGTPVSPRPAAHNPAPMGSASALQLFALFSFSFLCMSLGTYVLLAHSSTRENLY